MLSSLFYHAAAAGAAARAPAWAATASARGSVRTLSFGSHVSDNDPEVLEREKQRNLRGETHSAIPNAPGWNEKLASDSEAVVKAERAPEMTVAEMQKITIETVTETETAESGASAAGAKGARSAGRADAAAAKNRPTGPAGGGTDPR